MKTTLHMLLMTLAVLLVCTCCAAAEGILPVLQTPKPQTTYAISLDSATGACFSKMAANAEGGYDYFYDNVSYACYTKLSQKLGEEGYQLVSAETLESGVSRAVVSNGAVTLTLDYDLENKKATVSYPPFVFPREAALFDDFTELHDGDEITLCDDVTAKVTGWVKANNYYNPGLGKAFYSDENNQYIFLTLEVNYNRPEELDSKYLLRDSAAYYGMEAIGTRAQGILNNYTVKNYKGMLSWKMVTLYAMVICLTAEQAQHPENTVITFTSYDNATRYVYHLQTPDVPFPG